MAEVLLDAYSLSKVSTFLDELGKLSFSIDHPITLDIGTAVLTIRFREENDEYFITAIEPR